MTRKYHKYEETHREVDGRKQKYCVKCLTWKDFREFNKDRSSPDGLDMHCRDCTRAHGRARYRKAAKKKKITLYLRYNDRHRTVRGVKQKLCTKCNKWKKQSEYYKSKSEKDGLMVSCRECTYKPNKKKSKAKRKK
jgi:hypothetical protein